MQLPRENVDTSAMSPRATRIVRAVVYGVLWQLVLPYLGLFFTEAGEPWWVAWNFEIAERLVPSAAASIAGLVLGVAGYGTAIYFVLKAVDARRALRGADAGRSSMSPTVSRVINSVALGVITQVLMFFLSLALGVIMGLGAGRVLMWNVWPVDSLASSHVGNISGTAAELIDLAAMLAIGVFAYSTVAYFALWALDARRERQARLRHS